MGDLSEMIKNATAEQIEKVKLCKTTEQILKVAKSEGIEIMAAQAEEILKMIAQPYAQLSDEETDNVAGGYAIHNTVACRACQEGNCIVHGTYRR